MALLLQTLSPRLGIVSRRDLAQACRDEYPRAVSTFFGSSANSQLSLAIWPKYSARPLA